MIGDLPPAARTEVERILAAAARRILAEQSEPQPAPADDEQPTTARP